MKNRYGQDGMTYNVKMDTNNGHISFENKIGVENLDAPNENGVNSAHKELAKKFFSVESFDNSQGQIIKDYQMLFTHPDKNTFIRLKDFYKLNDI